MAGPELSRRGVYYYCTGARYPPLSLCVIMLRCMLTYAEFETKTLDILSHTASSPSPAAALLHIPPTSHPATSLAVLLADSQRCTNCLSLPSDSSCAIDLPFFCALAANRKPRHVLFIGRAASHTKECCSSRPSPAEQDSQPDGAVSVSVCAVTRPGQARIAQPRLAHTACVKSAAWGTRRAATAKATPPHPPRQPSPAISPGEKAAPTPSLTPNTNQVLRPRPLSSRPPPPRCRQPSRLEPTPMLPSHRVQRPLTPALAPSPPAARLDSTLLSARSPTRWAASLPSTTALPRAPQLFPPPPTRLPLTLPLPRQMTGHSLRLPHAR